MADPIRLVVLNPAATNPNPLLAGQPMPGRPDEAAAYVTLVDANGNPVGGSANVIFVQVLGLDVLQEVLLELAQVRAGIQLMVNEIVSANTDIAEAV